MSRIGKQPIAIPPKVKVEVKGQKVSVEGPKGKLDWELPKRTSLKVQDGNIVVSRDGDDAQARALHGLSRALLPAVEMPHSRMKENLANILKQEGYVAEVTVEAGMPKKLKLKLKYQGKKSVIEGLRRISKPGLRHYVGATEIPRVLSGMGGSIISTPEGVMTGTQARKKNLGGELLCYVW